MAKTQTQTQKRQSPETLSRKPTRLYRLGYTAVAHPWAFIVTSVVVFVAVALLPASLANADQVPVERAWLGVAANDLRNEKFCDDSTTT